MKKILIVFIFITACSVDSSPSTEIDTTLETQPTIETTSTLPSEETDSDHDHNDEDHSAHSHSQKEVDPSLPIPTISVDVLEDPKSGYNLFLDIQNHTFNPKSASEMHVDGEGHAHLYINEEKITRIYSEAYYLGNFQDGTYTIRVELSSNDHSVLTYNNNPIEDIFTLVVGHSKEHEETPKPISLLPFDYDLIVPDGVPDKLEVLNYNLGNKAELFFDSPVETEIHVHGYDIHFMVYPNQENILEIELNIAGEFEIEDHDSGYEFARLIVSP